jgi:hypothetical protein
MRVVPRLVRMTPVFQIWDLTETRSLEPVFRWSLTTLTNNEFLAVWQGDDNTGAFVNDEVELFGQRINASGAEVGANDFRLSDMGPSGDANYAAFEPAVAYNPTNNQYLVVWSGTITPSRSWTRSARSLAN